MVKETSERVYIIPLRKAKRKPRVRRANAAIRVIIEFLERHMKTEEVKIGKELNEFIWKNGIHTIPPKVKVNAKRMDKVVYAELVE